MSGKKPDKQPPSSRADHLKEHQFKPGQSGNPGGRAKGSLTLRGILRKVLREGDGEKAKEIVRGLIAEAEKTDSKDRLAAIREVFTQAEGKPPQTLTLTNEDAAEKLAGVLSRLLEALPEEHHEAAIAAFESELGE